MRRGVALIAVLLICVACQRQPQTAGADTVVLGVGSTTEQQMLAALTVVALRDAGYAVRLERGLGSSDVVRRTAIRGSVDVFWGYTGSAWSLGRGEQAPPPDPAESWERIRRADEDSGLVWLDPTAANATLALFVHAEALPPAGQQRGMTWLAQQLSTGEHELCADPDFIQRPGGLEALAQEYAIALDALPTVPAAEEEAIAAVAAGECFAGLATATSGEAATAGLVPVADELRVFPAFVVAPVVREGSAADDPAVAEALLRITELLDTRTLAALNGEFEDSEDPEALAQRFLRSAARQPTPESDATG